MLVNWSGKFSRVFGGRIFRILILFLCTLAILVGVYRARGNRIEKEQLQKNRPLKHSATNLLPSSASSRWVIVANPANPEGDQFVCSVARVAKDAAYAWKTIIIGEKVECCRMPDCYSIHTSQFLRMSYRTASTLKSLMEAESLNNGDINNNNNATIPTAYKEVVRNLAYIWVIHRGARHVFDAYVDEYIAAGVSIPQFEEELSRQLHTLALDESLALVEDSKSHQRGRSAGVFRNPYAHFGRPDVRLVPGGTGNGNNYKLELARHTHNVPLSAAGVKNNSSRKASEFPTFRICEVRPPSIEKALEIDDGWWDLRAPALVLPGDTMPPLCTRNTMFSPDVFWALPILPDYASGEDNETEILPPLNNSTSRIPPWYIRGLWSQSLLGDLGGSIRLTLSRVPTLQLNQNYFTGGDYEPSSSPSTSKLLKRWHCKSRSTFRCLLLMSKELSKSVYLRKHDLALIESWIIDLKSIHYAEPPMLPRRRSHTNPCLGADGLHGVSFFPALEPAYQLDSEYSVAKRNDTLRQLVSAADKLRVKREQQRQLSPDLTPPNQRSTYFSTDWSAYTPVTESSARYSSSSSEDRLSSSQGPVTYYSHFREHFRELEDSPSEFVRTLVTHSKQKAELVEKHRQQQQQNRSAKQFLSHFPWSSSTKQASPESSSSSEEDFPILKAMAENMCTGFGPLIPFKPRKTYDDLLLIVVFSNQHYDLIPTLEVLYRSIFPNMLYCGHPHVSVDLFLRKYQTAEHRSFSFLPTYTRATYECVLGAMEMNYEVKGYIVISDETLMKSWNIDDLDKNKIWVSSSTTHDSRHVPVTKASWRNLDPRGQKLPRLLDGIINTWKLFSYILVGHDGWVMDNQSQTKVQGGSGSASTIKKKRSVTEDKKDNNKEQDPLEVGESSYVPHQIDSYSPFSNDSAGDVAVVENKGSNSLKSEGSETGWDLSPSDWDKGTILSESSNETASTTETDGDVEVGEEDENESSSQDDLLSGSLSTSSTIEPPIVDELESVLLPTPSSELFDSLNNNSNVGGSSSSTAPSSLGSLDNGGEGGEEIDSVSTTAGSITTTGSGTDSSVGVPLYHVEHAEPPTPSTWHRPEDEATLSPENINNTATPAPTVSQEVLNKTVTDDVSHNDSVAAQSQDELLEKGSSTNYDSSPLPSITTPPTPLSSSSTSPRPSSSNGSSSGFGSISADAELGREMELLLEHVQDVYLNMLHVVSEYKEFNESKSHEFSSEGPSESSRSLLEDTKSHRISPREFRHIRCTLLDDGHQSELCASLRSFISILGQNLGGEIELDYDTIPMYYLPSWATKSFYSVANVLLHFGVMDELALPLLFRGLAPENEWFNLKRSAALKVISEYEKDASTHSSSRLSSSPSPTSISSSTEEDSSSFPAHYFHPFNLHKVHSDPDKRKLFCSNYLLKVFQM